VSLSVIVLYHVTDECLLQMCWAAAAVAMEATRCCHGQPASGQSINCS